MTHFEQLKRATTHEEIFNALYEFETDFLYSGKPLDIHEWLDTQRNPTETMLKGILLALAAQIGGDNE